MMRRRSVAATALTMGVLVSALAGCSHAQAPVASPSRTTTSSQADTPDNDTEPSVPDTLSPESEGSAATAATKALAVFADHDRPYAAWWAAFSPLLTNEAYQDYEYTDPTQVPVSKVTGAGRISAAPSATEATVLVPTNVGQYQVQLQRQSTSAPWFVGVMTPPQGVK
jgi:hypothetical protein